MFVQESDIVVTVHRQCYGLDGLEYAIFYTREKFDRIIGYNGRVICTSGKFTIVIAITTNLRIGVTTGVNFSLVSVSPVVHLELWVSSRKFEKNLKCHSQTGVR